jgi:hypothetical protein
MSFPAIISSGSDRITRTTRLTRPPGAGNARPRSRSHAQRVIEIAVTISVLMLIMLGGLTLRAVLALTQVVH